MRESIIERRIRAAIEKISTRGVKIRAIYLSPADRKSLDALASKRWGGSKVHRLSFDDHPIVSDKVTFDGLPLRDGTISRIYDQFGCATHVPKALSHRTKTPKTKRKRRETCDANDSAGLSPRV